MLAVAFEMCSVGWTDDTQKRVRTLTEPEAAEARKAQARQREIAEDTPHIVTDETGRRRLVGLNYAEVHGLKVRPNDRVSRGLARAANWFAETALA